MIWSVVAACLAVASITSTALILRRQRLDLDRVNAEYADICGMGEVRNDVEMVRHRRLRRQRAVDL